MQRKSVLDTELLEALDKFEGKPFNDFVWRVSWASRDPLVGSSGGGRWSPDGSFEALYTSFVDDGAIAEIYHHLSLGPVASSSNNLLVKLKVSLDNALWLDVKQLQQIGIKDPQANRLDYEISQAIGDAAHMLDYAGLIVPSARWNCFNLVLFLDQIDMNEQIEVLSSSEINWPAWREKIKEQKNN